MRDTYSIMSVLVVSIGLNTIYNTIGARDLSECNMQVADEIVWIDEVDIELHRSTEITSAEVRPICIRQGLDTFSLYIGVGESDVAGLAIYLTSHHHLTYQGIAVDSLLLFDDGSNGDYISGDGVFSIDSVGLNQDKYNLLMGKALLGTIDALLRYDDGTEVTIEQYLGLHLLYIDQSIPIQSLQVLSENCVATEHVVSVAIQPVT